MPCNYQVHGLLNNERYSFQQNEQKESQLTIDDHNEPWHLFARSFATKDWKNLLRQGRKWHSETDLVLDLGLS